MKKTPIILILLITLLSCKKDNDSNDPSSFTWTHQNVLHTATSADAYISQSGLGQGPNQIVAFINNTSTQYRVSMRLVSLSANSYTVSLASNKFDYIDDLGNILAGTQGTVTISSNSNNKVNGNFSVKLINANSDTTLITGSFTNINIHP